jgi:hypothetical protein
MPSGSPTTKIHGIEGGIIAGPRDGDPAVGSRVAKTVSPSPDKNVSGAASLPGIK